MKHASRPTRLAATATVLALSAAVQAGPPAYSVRYLGPGQGAAAMNESGGVVGTATVAPGIRGWFASADVALTLLPLPPGRISSWANDINDAGVIVGAVGSASSPEFNGIAAAWTPDGAGGWTVEELGALPGHVTSNATALNNIGDVVGYSFNGTYRLPVRFAGDGSVVDLSATGIFDPQDVNDRRVVVDRSFTCKRLDLDAMVVEDLGVPTGQPSNYLATSGVAINESNQVAGLAILTTSTDCDRQAALYSDELGWQLLSGCGYANGASDLNDHGDVVMRLNVAPWVRFQGIGTFQIESLIAQDVGHWFMVNTGGAINNSRQIAAWAHNPTTGENGTVLLTPIRGTADLDGSGTVGFTDLNMLLAAWGPCGGCAPDLDGDGSVGFTDLNLLLAAWGS